ncbi:MAG: TIGR04211 family SH3 domain-containing protein [Gammaproteobacteria bacterium]|nr:TIGR04211 family SH3 domain-containing protein [Gammaproteobacteria bacterium]MDH5727570.1 TIGR04211 family SH3 domain-containing protein [Gammaproteobacteria bacterium]
MRSLRLEPIFITLTLCLLFLSFESTAETVYVGDTLRVGVRAEPASQKPSLAVVNTGTALEIIDRQGSFALVKTPAGIEGWVKSAYLTSKKPARVLLRDAQRQVDQLEQEIIQLKQMTPGQSIQKNTLNQTIERLEDEKRALEQQLRLGLGETSMESRPASVLTVGGAQFNPFFMWFGLTTFFLALGFLVGVSWHKSQVTKRLGGLTL